MSQPVTSDEILAAALGILRDGGFPIPIQWNGKRPVMVRGLHDALTREEQVRAIFSGRRYNIAEPTGLPGRFDVLDIDVRPEGTGWPAVRRLSDAGLLAGAQRFVRTPSGGAHIYFAPSKQRSGRLPGHHLDFKAAGGYAVVPPSVVGGRRYEVVDDRPPTGATLDWAACRRLLEPPRPVPVRDPGAWTGSVGHLPGWLAAQGEGNRNNALYWAARRAAEVGDREVLDGLADAAVQAGLDEREAARTVASAVKAVQDGR